MLQKFWTPSPNFSDSSIQYICGINIVQISWTKNLYFLHQYHHKIYWYHLHFYLNSEICTLIMNLFSGKFTCLEVVFKFKRRLGYYLFHTYVPTCLIVIMSWISFWIKPEAVPARVTLGVTSLLTLSTQHANSQKSLPPVSYIKAIDVFMSGCTVSTKNLHKK